MSEVRRLQSSLYYNNRKYRETGDIKYRIKSISLKYRLLSVKIGIVGDINLYRNIEVGKAQGKCAVNIEPGN